MKKRILPAVLMLGGVSQIGQVLLLRELLMTFQGNELSIGIILAAWMIWVGVGSFCAAFLSERIGSPITFLKISAMIMLIVLPASILLIRNLRSFFDILPGAYLSLSDISLSSFLVVAPACFLLGAQFVFLAKSWRQMLSAKDSSGAGKTYVAEAAGNMLGGIVFTFLMVRHMSPLESAVMAGAIMLAAFMTITPPEQIETNKKKTGLTGLISAVLLIMTVLAFPYLRDIDDWGYQIQWKNFSPQHNLVDLRHSKHGTITVTERESQYSFFQSGHLIFSTAGPEAFAPELEEQDAVTFAHFSMMQHDNPKRILLIGGGLRGTLSEIARYPVEIIDYIELDEVLTDAARPYVSQATLDALSDERVRVIHTDGRFFIKATQDKYDMVIVDIPDPSTAVLNRYYTTEFFIEAKSVLESDGVFFAGSISTPDLRGTAIANRNTTIFHSLESVFDRVLVAGERFMFYIASDQPERITVDIATLQKRFSEKGVQTESFSQHHFHTFLVDSQLRRINWIVRNHGREPGTHITGPTPGPFMPEPIEIQEKESQDLPPIDIRFFINSDFKPIGYYYTLMFWERLTRADHAQTFSRILAINFNRAIVFLFLPLLLVIALRVLYSNNNRRPDTIFAVLFAVFTTGLSTMALQIALIFSFQSVYGFVYEIVGIIIAIFMCGLALGAYLSNRYVIEKSNMNTLAMVQFIIVIIAILVAFAMPASAQMRFPALIFFFFSLFTFISGVINGLDFPIAVSCFMALRQRAEISTGLVYGVELFGACTGAILASAIVAPIMGITSCALLAAFAALMAFIVILISRRGN